MGVKSTKMTVKERAEGVKEKERKKEGREWKGEGFAEAEGG